MSAPELIVLIVAGWLALGLLVGHVVGRMFAMNQASELAPRQRATRVGEGVPARGARPLRESDREVYLDIAQGDWEDE